MKLSGKIAIRFGLLGIAVAVLAVFLCVICIDEEPALITPAQAARETAVEFLDQICEGDFDQASQLLYGSPSLGVNRAPDSDVGKLVWDAYVSSIFYDLVSECYASGTGVAVDVRLTYLDFDKVYDELKARCQANIAARVEAEEDIDLIYDENLEYRDEFIADVVRATVEEILAEEGNTCTVNFTMQIIYENETWQIVPNDALLDAISGGVLK